MLECTERPEATVLTVTVRRLDIAVAEAFKREAAAHARRTRKRVVLDIRAVEFMDSSGLAALVGLLKAIEDPDRLVLLRPTRQVLRVLELTRLTAVFTIRHDLAGV